MSIAIVDRLGNVVGWTDTPPSVIGGRLVHPDAAALIGEDLSTSNIQLTEAEHVARAGAPAGWPGPWRCMALCPQGVGAPLGLEPGMRVA